MKELLNLNRGTFTHTVIPEKQSESGRSMVEMLGTLAIIGLLSVMGIAAFRSAMSSHEANTIVQAVNRRATTLAANKTFGMGFFLDSSFNNDIDYTITCIPSEGDFFTCSVADIPQVVCEKILNLNWQVPYHITPKACSTITTLTAYFKSDLGNTPVSFCPSGFSYYKGGCIPDDTVLDNGNNIKTPFKRGNSLFGCGANDRFIYPTEGDLCEEVCPNRMLTSSSWGCITSPVCILKNAPSNKPLRHCNGVFKACPSAEESVNVRNETGQGDPEQCLTACSNTWLKDANTTCQSCESSNGYTSSLDYCTRNCSNRIWDTTSCLYYNGSWNPCSKQDGTCPSARQIRCLCSKCPGGQTRNPEGNGCQ